MSLYHDVIEALTPLVEAFERLGIVYYIGGSVSSSLHGMARRTQDVDLIADLKPNQVRLLARALQSEYYLDEQAWQDAVRRGLPYNVIHLDTMMKVDLIPLKQRAYSREEARRAQTQILEAGTRPVRVASAEDAILTKLEWFVMGGGSSGRQWNDILGILKRQSAVLDLGYLARWADALGVRDQLERALVVRLHDYRNSPSIFLGGDLPLHTSYARWCVLAACIRSGLTTTLRRLPRCRTHSTVGFIHGTELGTPHR